MTIRCLVTGATGYIGGRLVPRLLDRGHRVRALARNPDKLAALPWRTDAEVVRGDLTDADSLTAAFDGVDVVYYLVHSMGTSADFVADEARSARNVVAAAQRAGVRRLVYLSGLHPKGASLSRHLRSRTEVGEILLGSGIETVVLQAGIVIGSGSASFEMIRHLTDRLPVMTTPKWVRNKIQPIGIDDVLHYLAESASAAVPESRTWDVGGPDVLEYGEAMQVYADVARLRRRFIVVLPWLTPTIASWWVGLVTPMPSGLARPLVESLECDAVVANHDVDAVIPPPDGGLTSYRDAVAKAVHRQPLPSDPPWAGETAYVLDRCARTGAAAEELWKVLDDNPFQRQWRVASREPGRLLRLHTRTRAGQTWLEMAVEKTEQMGHEGATGSRYHQRMAFHPRGLAGLAYWFGGLPVHRRRFRRVFSDVMEPR